MSAPVSTRAQLTVAQRRAYALLDTRPRRTNDLGASRPTMDALVRAGLAEEPHPGYYRRALPPGVLRDVFLAYEKWDMEVTQLSGQLQRDMERRRHLLRELLQQVALDRAPAGFDFVDAFGDCADDLRRELDTAGADVRTATDLLRRTTRTIRRAAERAAATSNAQEGATP